MQLRRCGGWVGLALVCCVHGCHALYPFDVPDSPDQGSTPDAPRDATLDRSNLQDSASEESLLKESGPAPDQTFADVSMDTSSPDAGKPQGALCKPGECSQGLHCVDGYCCGALCGATCVACNVPGKEGSCVPVPAADSKLCYKKCSGAGIATATCDGAGTCGIGTFKACPSFLVCDPTVDACPAGCKTHADCVKMDLTTGASLSSGVCDRTQAHKTGLGVCVDPGNVAEAGTPAFLNIDSALNKATETASTITHVLLRAGTTHTTYQVKVVGGQQVTIVGVGRPILQSMTTTDSDAALLVKGGTLLVQEVTVTHMSTFKGNGARCLSGTLGIFESTIRDNSNRGVVIDQPCDFELRRSLVQDNAGGGLLLQGGGGKNSAVVNNVVVKNGAAASMAASNVGGLMLIWSAPPLPLLYNNVIADNTAAAGALGGVTCDVSNLPANTKYDLRNTIAWSNSPQALSGGCRFFTSAVQGISNGTTGNIGTNPLLDPAALYELKTGSPAVDTGSAVPTSVTVIDYNSGARLQGLKTDMGAHER